MLPMSTNTAQALQTNAKVQKTYYHQVWRSVQFDVQSDAHKTFVGPQRNLAVPPVVLRFRTFVREYVRARGWRMNRQWQASQKHRRPDQQLTDMRRSLLLQMTKTGFHKTNRWWNFSRLKVIYFFSFFLIIQVQTQFKHSYPF